MEKSTLNSALASKLQYLKPKDAEILITLGQEIDQFKIARLIATKTYNPTTIALLYWLLPIFWLFNRSFTEQRSTGLLQFVMAIIVFPGFRFFQQFGWMPSGGEAEQWSMEQTVFQLCWGGVLIILTLWFFVDGFTIASRVRKGNFKRLKKALK